MKSLLALALNMFILHLRAYGYSQQVIRHLDSIYEVRRTNSS